MIINADRSIARGCLLSFVFVRVGGSDAFVNLCRIDLFTVQDLQGSLDFQLLFIVWNTLMECFVDPLLCVPLSTC